MIDVAVLVGAQVRESATGRTGRITHISLPWVKVGWNPDPLYRTVEETYARSDQRIWTDFELFTLNGGWVSMGSILGARPRGRIKQFTEEIASLLDDSDRVNRIEERIEIPNAEEQKEAWRLLAKALKKTKLPTSSGIPRDAKKDEFMLMHTQVPFYAFKHRATRNYVYVNFVDAKGTLSIPKTSEPFQRGEFDEEVHPVQTEVFYRENRSLPFRKQVFPSQVEASEFVSKLFDSGHEEIRWRTDAMMEDWEVELSGLHQALAEGCKACEGAKLENLAGLDLFKRKVQGPESKPEEWDCDDDEGCVHEPTGFRIKIDFKD